MGLIIGLFSLAFVVFIVASVWRVFEKAGQPGWGALIPVYNIYLMTKMAGRESWWVLLFFIPGINIVAYIILNVDIAKKFGKGEGFGVGLAFLPFIFYPILGFGDAVYEGDGNHDDDLINQMGEGHDGDIEQHEVGPDGQW